MFVEGMYLHLLKFYLRDIFNERFEANKHLTGNPFLSLLRYCGENNAFDRIFRFVWPEFVDQLCRLPDYEQVVLPENYCSSNEILDFWISLQDFVRSMMNRGCLETWKNATIYSRLSCRVLWIPAPFMIFSTKRLSKEGRPHVRKISIRKVLRMKSPSYKL